MWKDLDRYQRNAATEGVMKRVFVGSMMDIFEDSKALEDSEMIAFSTTHELRQYLFHRIDMNAFPNLIFLFLTKRPEHILAMIPTRWNENGRLPGNVWFGTSVSDQQTADEYIGKLLKHTQADAKLFLSVEPQVGRISLRWGAWHDWKNGGKVEERDGKPVKVRSQYDGVERIKWVIQGGESGVKRRKFDPEWARELRDECKEAGIKYFFKQIDKVADIPEDLMVREMPVL